MLYILTLEPMDERYTEQWYRWFKRDLMAMEVPFQYIDGDQMTTGVEAGTVLDAVGTNYWKFTQLAQVCNLWKAGEIKAGDVFFTADMWHPGLEAIPYMSTLTKIPVRVYSFVHAGSYTTEDFAAPMAPWAQHFERGWAKLSAGVFTGTQYHKSKLVRERSLPPNVAAKIYVTGYPFDTGEAKQGMPVIPVQERPRRIVYSHRWDIEKRPNVFAQMMNVLWTRRQDFEVWITTSRPEFRTNEPWLLELFATFQFPYQIKIVPKAEYYQILATSKISVSTTIEEGFGYCLLEAMTMGCVPVVPNDFSHPELVDYDSRFLYNGMGEALDMLERYLDDPPDTTPLQKRARYYDHSIERMVTRMVYDV